MDSSGTSKGSGLPGQLFIRDSQGNRWPMLSPECGEPGQKETQDCPPQVCLYLSLLDVRVTSTDLSAECGARTPDRCSDSKTRGPPTLAKATPRPSFNPSRRDLQQHCGILWSSKTSARLTGAIPARMGATATSIEKSARAIFRRAEG